MASSQYPSLKSAFIILMFMIFGSFVVFYLRSDTIYQAHLLRTDMRGVQDGLTKVDTEMEKAKKDIIMRLQTVETKLESVEDSAEKYLHGGPYAVKAKALEARVQELEKQNEMLQAQLQTESRESRSRLAQLEDSNRQVVELRSMLKKASKAAENNNLGPPPSPSPAIFVNQQNAAVNQAPPQRMPQQNNVNNNIQQVIVNNNNSKPRASVPENNILSNASRISTLRTGGPRKVLINFAHNCCKMSQRRSCDQALKYGFDECIPHRMDSVDETFKQQHSNIFSQGRGAGYWLWKPYIILKTLNQLNDGDILMYTDSGSHFIAPAEPLFKLVEQEPSHIVFFSLCGTHKNYIWTKRDAFVLIGCETETCTQTVQYNAAFIVIKRTPYVLEFFQKYLTYASDERILTDMPNTQGLPNYSGFQQHRHDQSVMTLVALKEGIRAYHDPTEWGTGCKELQGGDYDVLIAHTRDKS